MFVLSKIHFCRIRRYSRFRAVFVILSATIPLFLSYLFAQTSAVKVLGAPQLLSKQEGYYMAPQWSPDGSTIAVTGPKYTGIFVISFPNGNMMMVSDDLSAGFGMKWSHDSDKIAARIARYEGNIRTNAIAIFDLSTGNKTIISDYISILPGTPEWTSDDQYIYLNGTDRFRLYSIHETSHEKNAIAPSPEGKVVLIVKDRIKLVNISTQSEQVIQAPEGRIINLTVSPDRTKLSYEVMGGHLWVSDVTGKQRVDLGWGYAPSWSPDSQKIAYMITTDDGHRYLSSDIFVVNYDGTGKVNITQTSNIIEIHPVWSPDGKWIAYNTVEGEIYILEVR